MKSCFILKGTEKTSHKCEPDMHFVFLGNQLFACEKITRKFWKKIFTEF